jgi:crossover junction endodeoxyribonuclease RusA
MNSLTLELPYPPSVNHYWRHPNKGKLVGRHVISHEGREYRVQVHKLVLITRLNGTLTGRLWVDIELYPPDQRRRDLDNAMKSLLDALQFSGVYRDDSQIDRLLILRRTMRKDGLAVVTIQPTKPV